MSVTTDTSEPTDHHARLDTPQPEARITVNRRSDDQGPDDAPHGQTDQKSPKLRLPQRPKPSVSRRQPRSNDGQKPKALPTTNVNKASELHLSGGRYWD
ncbi:hypothetical protein [Kibdelosporangium philippinense]|uniref:hypothetical protein n=1 Tax=Kibdelosporangium philippinense TaxID=211113 RepID=UPI0036137AA4